MSLADEVMGGYVLLVFAIFYYIYIYIFFFPSFVSVGLRCVEGGGDE